MMGLASAASTLTTLTAVPLCHHALLHAIATAPALIADTLTAIMCRIPSMVITALCACSHIAISISSIHLQQAQHFASGQVPPISVWAV